MIELFHTNDDLWSDESNDHVIVEEAWVSHNHDPGFYVRDYDGERGPYDDFAVALDVAGEVWGVVTLAPANRLRAAIEVEDENDVGTYLLEYLATYGTAGIDAKALATRVFERIAEED